MVNVDTVDTVDTHNFLRRYFPALWANQVSTVSTRNPKVGLSCITAGHSPAAQPNRVDTCVDTYGIRGVYNTACRTRHAVM